MGIRTGARHQGDPSSSRMAATEGRVLIEQDAVVGFPSQHSEASGDRNSFDGFAVNARHVVVLMILSCDRRCHPSFVALGDVAKINSDANARR
jgi:hypothetical protein